MYAGHIRNRLCAQEGHEPRYELVAGPLENVDEDGHERASNGEAEGPSLDHVGHKKHRCSLIEAVAFLNDKRLEDRKRE